MLSGKLVTEQGAQKDRAPGYKNVCKNINMVLPFNASLGTNPGAISKRSKHLTGPPAEIHQEHCRRGAVHSSGSNDQSVAAYVYMCIHEG
ncbi:hypothetical protein STEG23_023786 [Scotinomys teguina]